MGCFVCTAAALRCVSTSGARCFWFMR
jgi:hypothetical protein